MRFLSIFIITSLISGGNYKGHNFNVAGNMLQITVVAFSFTKLEMKIYTITGR